MRSSAVLMIFAASAALAQQYNYTFPPGFNLGAVNPTMLDSWCQGERNTCPQVCDGVSSSNTCDSTTLDFSCVCANGTTPDLSPYENTIPFYVCKEAYGQCIANNPNNLQGQDYCKGNATCGTVILGASSSTSAAPTTSAAPSSTLAPASTTAGSATASSTGSATGASASATSSKGAAAIQLAQDHSTGFFAAALLGLFGMLL